MFKTAENRKKQKKNSRAKTWSKSLNLILTISLKEKHSFYTTFQETHETASLVEKFSWAAAETKLI